MRDGLINGYITKNYSGAGFTQQQLKVLKDGSLEEFVDAFVHLNSDMYSMQLKCILKAMKKMLGEGLSFEQIVPVNEYKGDFLACQIMDGDEDVFLGIGGQVAGLLKVASVYGQEEFQELDADAYDALCELINCVNGLFATELSSQDIEVILRPPVFYNNVNVQGKGFYVAGMSIYGISFDIILSLSGMTCA